MATQRISIIVALDGADDGLKRALSSAEKSLNTLATSATVAGEKAAAGLAEVKTGMAVFSQQIERARTQLLAFVGITWAADKLQQIVSVADAWNQMNARLKLATLGQQEFNTAQDALFGIAQRIGVPLQETATLYGKLQQAVRMLGGEQTQAFTLTESISQALRISGASANEAQSALLQFGQALASGVLRGEEFNSVVENSPRLAQALADGLNVPIGRLRKLAEEGRLTADVVVNALLSQKDKLADEYAQLPMTVTQAFERLQNAFGRWVNEVDTSTGLTRKLAEAMTYVADHIETLMTVLTRLAEVGLGVLVYRMIPALITAWQTASAAAIASANASIAAWATMNLSVDAAIAGVGALKVAFSVLGAFLVGWEIGTWLSERFETIRKAGILMVSGLLQAVELLRYQWESFSALFTADTLAQATARHEARLAQMRGIFQEMLADASRSGEVSTQAMNLAATSAETIAKRLEAVRQGTQEAVGRGLESLDDALNKLKSRIGVVEQEVQQAQQRMTEALGHMSAAYQTANALIDGQLAQQIAAIKARTDTHLAELERSRVSETAHITQSTQILTQSLQEQADLRTTATQKTLQLMDEEGAARIEAARRAGETDAQRVANTQRVENDILTTKRQTLTQALDAYRQHIDALNSEAERHLTQIKRIEDEKRLLALSTEDRIREIQRQSMTDVEAMEDRKRQISQLQSNARQALLAGDFETAKRYAQQAMDLSAQVASSEAADVKRLQDSHRDAEQMMSQITKLEAASREAFRKHEYDQADALMRQADQLRADLALNEKKTDGLITEGKADVRQAIESIKDSQELLNQSFDAEAAAHQKAANTAINARQEIQKTLQTTEQQVDVLTQKLKDGLNLTLIADTSQFEASVEALDKALGERERLIILQVDLTKAQEALQVFESTLKNGQLLPIDADVAPAQAALADLRRYAIEHTQLDLRVNTEKAQAALNLVQHQIHAMQHIQTQSDHRVSSNADAVRSQVLSLNGMHTSSTHTIVVKKVEAHASGGMVGIPAFASGGGVSAHFPRMRGGKVPGSGNGDTVPRTLDGGAFVLRKAAVQKYGAKTLSRLANGIAHFARGGTVSRRRGFYNDGPMGSSMGQGKRQNREAVEMLKTIELGLKGMDQYTQWLQRRYVGSVSPDMNRRTMKNYSEQAEMDRRSIQGFIDRPTLTENERSQLERMRQTWRGAMAQPLLWGEDYERQLIDFMAAHEGEFLNKGGVAKSDTIPAMLTPGEYVVNKEAVNRYGTGLFTALNSLSLPAEVLKTKIQGFATGGFVGPSLPTLSPSLPPPRVAETSAPSRTLRVELATGKDKVTATINAQDEGRLLALLKEAQSRSI